MKRNLNNTVDTKDQLKFIIATDIFIFLTIGLILYERKKFGEIKYAFFALGLIFLMLAVNQHIYLKNNPQVKIYKIMRLVYALFGILILLLAIFNLFK